MTEEYARAFIEHQAFERGKAAARADLTRMDQSLTQILGVCSILRELRENGQGEDMLAALRDIERYAREGLV